MLSPHKNRLQMFRRVRDFLRTDPVPPVIQPTLVAFEGTIIRLEEHAAQQDHRTRQSRAATERVHALERTLRSDLMQPVSLFARALFASGGTEHEGIRRSLTMPRKRDYQELIAAAQGMAQLLGDHEARFVAAGLPADHRTRLIAGAEALRSAVAARGAEAGKRNAATVGTRLEAQEGLLQVKIIDTLVRPTLRDDAVRLAEWRSAMSVARVGGGRSLGAGVVQAPPVGQVLGGVVVAAAANVSTAPIVVSTSAPITASAASTGAQEVKAA